MGQGRLIFFRRRRINKSMKLIRDEFDYYFNLDKISVRVKDFDLKGKSVSLYFHSGNCHVYKAPRRGAHYFFRV